METEFDKVSETIIPRVQVLIDNTGVGGKDKSSKGILWKDLKDLAFALVDKGIIEIYLKKGIPIVNVKRLKSLEIKLGKEALTLLR